MNENKYLCVGIDASLGGWMMVALSENGCKVKLIKTIDEICDTYKNADRIIIDIPIGLPESEEEAVKRPDNLLRKSLKGKASTVFPVPCRQAVFEEDDKRAKELNLKYLKKSLSNQSLGFRKAIRQVDVFLMFHIGWKNRLLESHPEYCFKILNNGQPVLEKKKEKEGQEKRLSILERYYPEAGKVLGESISKERIDDVIDALCLAVVGRLSLSGGNENLAAKTTD